MSIANVNKMSKNGKQSEKRIENGKNALKTKAACSQECHEAKRKRIEHSNDETDARFIERNHLIQMAVQAEEEREFLNQSSDHEISMDESNMDQSQEANRSMSEDGEIVEETIQIGTQNSIDSEQVDLEMLQNEARSTVNLKSGQSPSEQFKQIDNEMLKKITELHKLMSGGRLSESAAMLSKCAETLTKRAEKPKTGINENSNCKSKKWEAWAN